MASDTLALLIDGDNASPKIITGLLARLSDLVAASGLVDMESTGDHPKIITVKLKAAPAAK